MNENLMQLSTAIGRFQSQKYLSDEIIKFGVSVTGFDSGA